MLAILEEICARGYNLTDLSKHIGVSGQNASEVDHVENAFRQGSKEYKQVTLHTMRISLEINIYLCIAQLLLFWILSRVRPDIFAPRLNRDLVPKCPLGWVGLIWKNVQLGRGRSARNIARRLNNLDAAVMVRFCILGFKFSFAASLVACFLLPWYSSAPAHCGGELNTSEGQCNTQVLVFKQFNLANLAHPDLTTEQVEAKFWPAVAAAWILTLIFVHFSMEEWANFDIMRKEHFTRLACGHMESERPGAAQAVRSVLVEMVPQPYRNVNAEAIHSFFSRLFPHNKVHSVVVQPQTGELHGKVDALMMNEGRKTIKSLRRALAPQIEKAKQERIESSQSPAARTALREVSQDVVTRAATMGRSIAGSFALDDGLTLDDIPENHWMRGRSRTGDSSYPEHQSTIIPECDRCSLDALTDGEEEGRWRGATEGASNIAIAAIGHGRHVAQGFLHRAQGVAGVMQDIAFPQVGGIDVGSSTAFVTFSVVSDAVMAQQLVLSQKDVSATAHSNWIIKPCPEAQDIYWVNAAVPYTQSWARTFLVKLALFVCMLFWVIPVGLITVWSQLDVLKLRFRWIEGLKDNEYSGLLYIVLNSYLPVLAQMLLLYLLPCLLELMGKRLEGEKTKSEIQVATTGRYLLFLLVTIYCTIVGNSLLLAMCQILEQPSNIFQILQKEVPAVASYFITYVMARAGLSAPMLLLFAIISAWEPSDSQGRLIIRPNYAMESSQLVLVLVLGMTYCIIAPMISFACLIYFALTSLIYMFLFLYVYTPEYDCQGRTWNDMFRTSLLGLLLGVASLAGIASSYIGPMSKSFVALWFLVVFIVALFPIFESVYAVPAKYIPLEVAREIDKACVGKTLGWLHSDYYLDPVITGFSDGTTSGGGCCFCCKRRMNLVAQDEDACNDRSSESSCETISDATDTEPQSDSPRSEIRASSGSHLGTGLSERQPEDDGIRAAKPQENWWGCLRTV